jgi:ureidoacrylate peracid hydrolase
LKKTRAALADDLLTTLAQKAAPEQAALLVIDVQNDFAAENGFFHRVGANIPVIQRSVPPLIRLIDQARGAGVLVVFIQAIYDPEHVSAPMRERNARRGIPIPRCITGSWGADFYGVRPLTSEPVVIKHRYSAFTNPELKALLDRRGIRSLLLTGISTDTCVESTGRDFYFADYYVTLIADCCAAASEQDHAVTLGRFDRDYGAVVNSAEVIDAWQKQPRAGAQTGTNAHA